MDGGGHVAKGSTSTEGGGMTLQDAGAESSNDNRYCYRVWRRWDESLPRLGFILLNPPMGEQLGGTIDRCIGQARALDYGAIEVVYLFPLRTFLPAHLSGSRYAEGDRNKTDCAIMDLFDRCSTVVASWGGDAFAESRAEELKAHLCRFGYANHLSHFGLNKDGSPKSVDQLRGRTKPKRWVL